MFINRGALRSTIDEIGIDFNDTLRPGRVKLPCILAFALDDQLLEGCPVDGIEQHDHVLAVAGHHH